MKQLQKQRRRELSKEGGELELLGHKEGFVGALGHKEGFETLN